METVLEALLVFVAWTILGAIYGIWDNRGDRLYRPSDGGFIFLAKAVLYGPVAWAILIYMVITGVIPFQGGDNEQDRH